MLTKSKGGAGVPLDRAHITAASAVMVPTYIVVNLTFAAVFIVDPNDSMSLAPSLSAARDYLPMPAWGVLWLGVAAVMAGAISLRSRAGFAVAAAVNMSAWLAWGFLVEAALLDQQAVTPLAGVLPWAWAVANFATMRSLLAREV